MAATSSEPLGREKRHSRFSLPNGGYRAILIVGGAIFAALVIWFLYSIVNQSRPAFSTLGFSWIFQKTWNPNLHKFGLLPFILGTVETTAIAMVLAVPIGLGSALALAYLVPQRARVLLGTAVELLAAVPSVVYGLWGVIALAPLFREYVEPFSSSAFGWTGLFNGANSGVGLMLAGSILFVMVLPTMVAISRDVLAVVPKEQVEGAMALGATQWQVLRKVVLPEARAGLLGAFILATGRALGRRWRWPWSSATPTTSPTRSSRRPPPWPPSSSTTSARPRGQSWPPCSVPAWCCWSSG